MTYKAEILADSLAPNGARLTTFEVAFPRFVLSEFNTHCAISRNSASSRAVPVHIKIREALTNPVAPRTFGRNQRGMSAVSSLEGADHDEACRIWIRARDEAVLAALGLLVGEGAIRKLPATLDERLALVDDLFGAERKPLRLDVHKQITNRLLEPFLWQTVIATATEWSNFFALRTAEGAQPEIRTIAVMMEQLRQGSQPVEVAEGSWHLPFLQSDERLDAGEDPVRWAGIAAARCARVSYQTHNGERNVGADESLRDRLLEEGHMSPFEHVARSMTSTEFAQAPQAGKLVGWVPFRSTIPNEHDYSLVLKARH